MRIKHRKVHDIDSNAGEVSRSAVRGCANNRTRRVHIADGYVRTACEYRVLGTYTNSGFGERNPALLQVHIVEFTLPISVLTDTLRNVLYVRQNDTTKEQVWTIVEGAEASNHCRLVMSCGLNMARKKLLQSFNE